MTLGLHRRLALVAAALSTPLLACDSARHQSTPPVQHSAAAPPRWTVDLKRVLDGVFRVYRPRCLDTVRVGHTVEFRNFLPDVPTNVTSISGPEPLYSPNLVRPYNYVSPDDPENTLCKTRAADGSCAVKNSWSYWRFTFEQPGLYAWLDSNSGSPGQQIVDSYYGTISYVGLDPNSPFGTICVRQEDGGGCEAVCCTDDEDCSGGQRCFRLETDAVGTCLTPSG